MDAAIIEKFWKSVDKTDNCWNWIGIVDKADLPIIRVGTKDNLIERYARRISLEIIGRSLSPSDRVQPLVCKNKLCVNPAHLVCGDEARFWVKVQKLSEANGGCWVWTAGQDKDMYGKFTIHINGKQIDIRAHQYSYELSTGRKVPDGMLVCHTCDHPYCVNPAHLFLGDHAINHADRNQKGRQAKGETCGRSKLTNKIVKQVRESSKSGMTNLEISHKFVIAKSTVFDIVNRRTWKHLP